MNSHVMIDKWGQKKYKMAEGTKFWIEQESRSGGYCETCWYEYEVMVVYADVDGRRTQIDELRTNLSEMLNEIMDAYTA